jgi:hypothetical protein
MDPLPCKALLGHTVQYVQRWRKEGRKERKKESKREREREREEDTEGFIFGWC